ncbi:24693_t:CDS:2 [Dentiscutata erythropus]|uniref:24693_t:CDS:1 n=1 Tax=Dentiscutata erythropus TaxID=1348616 RepID=A0A9N9BXC3_9GLOM|nr:24693_t:CDS:2 [Dentiscutata erythropus]
MANKIIIDNIFAETHSKLEGLNSEISNLQDIYLTNDDSDEESDNEFIDNKTYDKTSSELL